VGIGIISVILGSIVAPNIMMMMAIIIMVDILLNRSHRVINTFHAAFFVRMRMEMNAVKTLNTSLRVRTGNRIINGGGGWG